MTHRKFPAGFTLSRTDHKRVQAPAFRTGLGHDPTGRLEDALPGLEGRAGAAEAALLDVPTRFGWVGRFVCLFLEAGRAGGAGGSDGRTDAPLKRLRSPTVSKQHGSASS